LGIETKNKELSQSQQDFVSNTPERFRERYKKALLTRQRKPSVDMKCLDCSNFQVSEIKNCPVDTCPLWNVRPYQQNKKVKKTGRKLSPEQLTAMKAGRLKTG